MKQLRIDQQKNDNKRDNLEHNSLLNEISQINEKISIDPEVLITELAQIEERSYLTCSEIYLATTYIQERIKEERPNWKFNLTQYSFERTLRYYYNSFEPINDIIVIKNIARHGSPSYVYDYVHQVLSNYIEEINNV